MTRCSIVLWLLAFLGCCWSQANAQPAQDTAESSDSEATSEPASPTPRLTRAPALKKFVEPEYPVTARAAGRTATVLLELEIDERGKVAHARVLGEPNPEFDEPALEAVRQFEFSPAEVDGEPAPVRLTYRYRFVLGEPEPTPPEPEPDHEWTGRVVLGDGNPARGVQLRVDSLDRHAVTDEQGGFSLGRVKPGTYSLRLSGPDIVPTVVEQGIPPAEPNGVVYSVSLRAPSSAAVDEEIVIRSSHLRRPAGATEVDAERGKRAAGALGDALNVVQNLPGVAATPTGSANLVVWGAAPAETRVYIDDVPVPALYHVGGFRSVLGDALVSSVELIPAGYGAEYGRALGGLVRVNTRELKDDGWHGGLTLDGLGTGAHAKLRSDEQRAAGAVTLRYSNAGPLLRALSEDAEEVVPFTIATDAATKLSLGTSQGGELSLLALVSTDKVERRLPSIDAATSRFETEARIFHRIALRHVRERSRRLDTALLWVGQDRHRVEADFDTIGTRQRAIATRYGGRLSRRIELTPRHEVTLGLDLEGSHVRTTRSGTLGLPGREGDPVVFGQIPGAQVADDEWTVDWIGVAGYVTATWQLLQRRLQLQPALRLEPQVQSGDRIVPVTAGGPSIGYSEFAFLVEPRLAALQRLTDRWNLHGAVGIVHQPPAASDLSPVFGATHLRPSRALHGVLGTTLRATDTTTLEATGFVRLTTDLVVRSDVNPPPVARALVNEGKGRAFGAQAVVRQALSNGVSGWLSYTLSRSEVRDAGARSFRLSDFDQTHQLTALLQYLLSEHWEVGSRLRVASGPVRTQVVGAYYDTRLDRYQPLFGEINQLRLPPSVQLDLHGEYRSKLGPLSWSAYLDVLNVTNQRNAIELVYSHDYSERGTLTNLPILAVLGIRAEY